jgi:hypothetical protein
MAVKDHLHSSSDVQWVASSTIISVLFVLFLLAMHIWVNLQVH